MNTFFWVELYYLVCFSMKVNQMDVFNVISLISIFVVEIKVKLVVDTPCNPRS